MLLFNFSNRCFISRSLCKILTRCCSSDTGIRTSLYDLHVVHKGKIVNFAGYQLPVQYGNEGIAASHRHTRLYCSLFDVSHMLQTEIAGNDQISFFESLCTTDIEGLPENSGALSLYTSESGGILDDLIVSKTTEGYLYIVSNASRRDNDKNLMLKAQEKFLAAGKDVKITFREPEERALLALQGPQMAAALQPLVQVDLKTLYFMRTCETTVCGIDDCRITRCGYTGEDGVEISLPAHASIAVAQEILQSKAIPVRLAGLGARDTLRLEAGLCLYGNDIDESTTPVSAGLIWTIGKRRRQRKDFPGADIILSELATKPKQKRVGLRSQGKGPPARPGAQIFSEQCCVGRVTSGCPSPSLNYNIGMGYVDSDLSSPETKLQIKVRDSFIDVVVSKLPFIETKYYINKNK